jgi:hypothetical protein
MGGARGVRAGGARIGIGTLGSMRSRSFRATESSTARSAGDSIHPGGYTELRSMGTGMVDTDTEMATDTTTTVSARIVVIGALALTT